jgi:flagellar hook assembly protein FlgD
VNQAVDAALNTATNNLSNAISGLTTTVSGIGSHESEVPAMFALFQNYPNPFNPATAISYQLKASSFVELRVYDALGRVVATLVNEEKPAGSHTVIWNAQNCPSGVYIYRIVAGNQVDSKKMLLTK